MIYFERLFKVLHWPAFIWAIYFVGLVFNYVLKEGGFPTSEHRELALGWGPMLAIIFITYVVTGKLIWWPWSWAKKDKSP